jgi:hypothetical protein
MIGCRDISKEAETLRSLELSHTGYIKDVQHRPGKVESCSQVMLCTYLLAAAITGRNADVYSPIIPLVV